MAADEVLYEVRGPKSLVEMSWKEVEEALQRTDTIILPVGSIEQHGPHLPLGTDFLQGIDFGRYAVRVLRDRGREVVLGPTIPFGVAPYHMDFPGTISLKPETLLATLMEVCGSLIHHGFKRIALLLAHGGNWPVMQTATQVLNRETDAQVIALNWLPFMEREVYPKVLKAGDSGHGGESETARGLVSHPKLVMMERARDFVTAKAKKAESASHPLQGGGVMPATGSYRKVSPDYGSTGLPTAATIEVGELSYQALGNWVADMVEQNLLDD